MAEVSQRLSSGAHRLIPALLQTKCRPSTLSTSRDPQSRCRRPAGTTESAGAGPERGPRESVPLVPPVPGVHPSAEPTHVHKPPSQVSPWVLLRADCCVVVVGRMTSCWSSKAYLLAAGHSEMFSSPLHFREFSTLTLGKADGGHSVPGCRSRPQRQVKHHLHILELEIPARCYCSSSSSAKPAAPLHRSRTAYYDLLKVSPHATQSQIKTAYYKQSMVSHPDKNPGDEEAARRFSEVSEAYAVLGNVGLRRKYDRGVLGPSDVQGAGRPSSKEAPGRAQGPHQHHQYQQHRHTASQQQFARSGGKPMFDFDAFYRAHYGEQLERERRARAQKEWFQEKRKESYEKWKFGKMMELTGVALAIGGVILLNVVVR
ncbi:DnaJ subfamily C member 30 [Merluccius polli]|uniref:DnaJ subfamily C member 30 n=1 Tax=Merluccius polli TaxID=89951 RepID=A0AA47MHG9_MERPO|nr:DnaJ subfamily C member 30 [Merluccius polli]